MGHTIESTSQAFAHFFAAYRSFARNLEPTEQAAFEKIENSSHKHQYCSVYASFPEPIYPVALSSIVEMQVAVADLERRAEVLEERMRRLKAS